MKFSYSVGGNKIVQPTVCRSKLTLVHKSRLCTPLPTLALNDFTLVAWNWPWREYLHYRIRNFALVITSSLLLLLLPLFPLLCLLALLLFLLLPSLLLIIFLLFGNPVEKKNLPAHTPGYSQFGIIWQVSYKIRYIPTLWPSNSAHTQRGCL